MHLGYDVNDYGTRISRHRCETCGADFTVCPAAFPERDWRDCMATTCASCTCDDAGLCVADGPCDDASDCYQPTAGCLAPRCLGGTCACGEVPDGNLCIDCQE